MGRVIFTGGSLSMQAPSAGVLASSLEVGSSVYLMENGTAVEYLVVNQGIPGGSSLYDSSCNGTWLLRKDIYSIQQWHTSKVNDYANSNVHNYITNTFFNLFNTDTQNLIKQVKIPYRAGSGSITTVSNGVNGLSTKIFLLSGYEIGWSNHEWLAQEGACLDYFPLVSGYGSANSSLIAYYNGTATEWMIRSPNCDANQGATQIHTVYSTGEHAIQYANSSYGVRPALILPSTAKFDKNTMILKG